MAGSASYGLMREPTSMGLKAVSPTNPNPSAGPTG